MEKNLIFHFICKNFSILDLLQLLIKHNSLRTMAIPVNASNRYQKLFKKRFLSIFCILFLILVLNVSGKKIDLISSVKDKTQSDGFDENKKSSLKSD